MPQASLEHPDQRNLQAPEIDSLLTRLDELVRWRPGSTGNYHDPQGALARIQGAANHVVMGRRGSGKTRLLDELRRRAAEREGTLIISFGAEDYKELAYPDILIQILRSFLQEFQRKLVYSPRLLSTEWWRQKRLSIRHPIRSRHSSGERRFLLQEVSDLLSQLKQLLAEAEELSAQYLSRRQESEAQEKSGGTSAGIADFKAEIGSRITSQEGLETERRLEQKEFKRTKVERLLGDFKRLLVGVCDHIKGRVIFAVDDFYFIRRSDQPAVVDYIHRICKDTDAYLKLATIRHRTELSEHDAVTRGVVAGHEIQPIDLELPLGHFDSIRKFLEAIWSQVCEEVGIADPHSIFMGEGFSQAVLASGGVPRDFFGVVKAAIQIARERQEQAVGKLRINEAARQYTQNTKLTEVLVDSAERREVRDLLLLDMVRFARDLKKKNCFHVNADRLAENSDIQRLLDSLVDGRLLHLITDNTSNARRAGQYAAYLLDVGLYAHPQKRGSNAVEEVEFWYRDDAGRLVNLQRSPVYPLRTVEELRQGSIDVQLGHEEIQEVLFASEDDREEPPRASDAKKQLELAFPPQPEVEVGE